MANTWTPERLALLQQINTGGSRSWIAARLNRETDGPRVTRNMVIGKLNRMGITPPKLAPRIAPTKPAPYQRPPEKYFRTLEVIPMAIIPAEAPPSKRARLLELRPGQCRYCEGDGGDAVPYVFCAHPVRDEDTSYCDYHHKLCHVHETRPLKMVSIP